MKSNEDLPVILCADLASEPNSPVVSLVRQSLSLNAFGPLHSAYVVVAPLRWPAAQAARRYATDTGLKTICEQQRREPLYADSMVDYIWHSGHLRVLKVLNPLLHHHHHHLCLCCPLTTARHSNGRCLRALTARPSLP